MFDQERNEDILFLENNINKFLSTNPIIEGIFEMDESISPELLGKLLVDNSFEDLVDKVTELSENCYSYK